MAEIEAIRTLQIRDSESAVRFLFRRPDKLARPTLEVIARLPGGLATAAHLLDSMSPVQAVRCGPRHVLHALQHV